MNIEFHIQILLGDLEPVHPTKQIHLILGLDHHQPSPETPFASYVYFVKKQSKDACVLAMIHSTLVNF